MIEARSSGCRQDTQADPRYSSQLWPVYSRQEGCSSTNSPAAFVHQTIEADASSKASKRLSARVGMDGEECAERVWVAPEVILVVDLEGRSAVDACLSVPLAGTRKKRAIVRVEPVVANPILALAYDRWRTFRGQGALPADQD